MKFPSSSFVIALMTFSAFAGPQKALFDGKSLQGWEGDPKVWRVDNGMLVAGNLESSLPQNEFLATTTSFHNFILKAKFRLEGTEGFVNSGIQFRSERVPKSSEMTGYQADIGEGWYGCLYDESRRNKVMARPPAESVKKAVKPAGTWNDYEIRCQGTHIVLILNGIVMVDYAEEESGIPQTGKLGLQIHGGGKTHVSFKDIIIEELP
jgi:hypothetical protein